MTVLEGEGFARLQCRECNWQGAIHVAITVLVKGSHSVDKQNQVTWSQRVRTTVAKSVAKVSQVLALSLVDDPSMVIRPVEPQKKAGYNSCEVQNTRNQL